MSLARRTAAAAVLGLLALHRTAVAQPAAEPEKEKNLATAFFDDETPLTATLTFNIRRIKGDKGENLPWRWGRLTLTEADGREVSVPTRVRARGIWRRKQCEMPPMRLNIVRDSAKETSLRGLDRPKLVNFCQNTPAAEQLLLQELQLYRIYQLLTPVSHKARLLRLSYADSSNGKVSTTRYAILLEEPDAMAQRLGGTMFDVKGAVPGDVDPFQEALFSMFQYFIGNTDFSLNQLHNAEIVGRVTDGTMLPVAYDFDFTGAVNAPYATVDPRLPIRQVRQRLFRGFCAPPAETAKVVALFNEKKDAIWALYSDQIGELLWAQTRRSALEYFDAFYRTINDPRSLKREIVDACRAGN